MRFSHFGITVDDVIAAERFYCALFTMNVFVREVKTSSGWKSLESGVTPEDAAANGLSIGMVVLQRNGLGIALTIESEKRTALLEHLAFVVEPADFENLYGRAVTLGCRVVQKTPRRFVFIDPYGMVWEIMDQDRLYSAKDMGYGWISRAGVEYPSQSELGGQ
jgi:catechol 2,3-dioxygenase-like lactoylglutathione lyase family enzyme